MRKFARDLKKRISVSGGHSVPGGGGGAQTGFLLPGFPKFPAAYKHADGKKIDGKRVLVDVERGRTVKGWLPRRLGKWTNTET